MTVLVVAPILALTKQESLYLWSGVLIAVLLFGAWVLSRLDRWRRRQMEVEDDSPGHAMSFREMYERGELSKEEYDRVLRRVASQAGASPKPVAPPAASYQEPASGPPATEEPPTPPPG